MVAIGLIAVALLPPLEILDTPNDPNYQQQALVAGIALVGGLLGVSGVLRRGQVGLMIAVGVVGVAAIFGGLGKAYSLMQGFGLPVSVGAGGVLLAGLFAGRGAATAVGGCGDRALPRARGERWDRSGGCQRKAGNLPHPRPLPEFREGRKMGLQWGRGGKIPHPRPLSQGTGKGAGHVTSRQGGEKDGIAGGRGRLKAGTRSPPGGAGSGRQEIRPLPEFRGATSYGIAAERLTR